MSTITVISLATRQLEAYNAKDIDAFCACYADDVQVLGENGEVQISGIEDFRSSYGPMFEGYALIEAFILSRMTLGPHLVERELWRRRKSDAGPIQEGEVLVRYTARGEKIAVVQFLHPTA